MPLTLQLHAGWWVGWLFFLAERFLEFRRLGTAVVGDAGVLSGGFAVGEFALRSADQCGGKCRLPLLEGFAGRAKQASLYAQPNAAKTQSTRRHVGHLRRAATKLHHQVIRDYRTQQLLH